MTSPRSILLIEDSDTQALLLGELLREEGMSVHRVASGEEGLAYLRSSRPDLAVVDFHLPGMQGNEFCRIIRDNSATASIPILILTDDTQADSEKYVLDYGADDYVAKSGDADILLARIDLLLRRSGSRPTAQFDETSFFNAQRVLVVDDSPTYLTFLQHELDQEGYSVLTAESGEAAIDRARRDHIDCAVIDLVMPGMDGIELCRQLSRLRQPGRSLPILIVTSKGSKEKMMESLEVGADDYVEKANDPTILKARIRALLRRKMLQDEHQRIRDEIRDKELEFVRERSRREAHLRAILDNAADAIVTVDAAGVIRSFSKSAEAIFGYAAAEALGRPVSILVSVDSEAGRNDGDFIRYLREHRHDDSAPLEVLARRRDGSQFPIELSAGELQTDDEYIFVCIMRDVTERRRSEEALRAADEQIHLLLDSVGEGVYGVDGDGLVTFVNSAALDMLGFAPDEVIGENAHDLFHHSRADGSRYPAEECPIVDTIRSGNARENVEDRFWRRDGAGVAVEFSSRPIVKDGLRVGAVVSFQDISRRQDLEARLRQSQKMDALGRLTGGVAHDFNNLLTVIMGNLQFLMRALGDDPRSVGRLERIMGAARGGAELTRRLLTFSRQQILETGTIDINELVLDLEGLLQRTIGETIVLTTAVSPEPCLGRTDRNQLEHALINLCVNARDAMPEGGRLTIETRRVSLDETYASSREMRPGNHVEIAVSDTGTGIEPAILEKIFEPFFTTKEMGKGTGLGLSSVFGFMKQSGGHVSVYSEVGHGATFKLLIPEAEEAATAARPQSPSAAPVRGQATVLVVEDDEAVRDVAVTMLADAGYDIVEAGDGHAGLQAFVDHPEINVVFSDVIMPGGMTGPDMVKMIRRRRPAIPVLFASGYAEQAFRDRDALLEHARFISKPYDVSELPGRIGALLEAER